MIIKDQKRNRGEAQKKKYPAKLDQGTGVVDEKREREWIVGRKKKNRKWKLALWPMSYISYH